MLYVFHGEDVVRGREKLVAFMGAVQKKKPNTPLERVGSEELDGARLEELLGTQGLFSGTIMVVLDFPSELKEGKELVLENAKEMAESENIFIIFEGKIDHKSLDTFTRHAKKVVSFGGKVAREEVPFNRFAITDALLKRDRKILWVFFERARREAVSEEEIHGMLFWQIKSMLLARDTKSAEETGLKPFVFSKAKSGALRFKEGELQKLASDLVTLYHEARRGKCDLGVALERWVLSV